MISPLLFVDTTQGRHYLPANCFAPLYLEKARERFDLGGAVRSLGFQVLGRDEVQYIAEKVLRRSPVYEHMHTIYYPEDNRRLERNTKEVLIEYEIKNPTKKKGYEVIFWLRYTRQFYEFQLHHYLKGEYLSRSSLLEACVHVLPYFIGTQNHFEVIRNHHQDYESDHKIFLLHDYNSLAIAKFISDGLPQVDHPAYQKLWAAGRVTYKRNAPLMLDAFRHRVEGGKNLVDILEIAREKLGKHDICRNELFPFAVREVENELTNYRGW